MLFIAFVCAGEQGETRPVLRRLADGRRLGRVGQQGLQALHLQIRSAATDRRHLEQAELRMK